MRKILAAIALLVAAPLAAQEATEQAPDFRTMSDAQLRSRLATLGPAVVQQRPCTELAPIYAELHRRHRDTGQYKGSFLVAQAFCSYEEQRYADSMRYLKRAERDFPERGAIEPLGVFLATHLEDGGEALTRLHGMAAAGTIATLPEDALTWIFRGLRAEGRGEELDAFAHELAASSAFARMDVKLQDSLAHAALDHVARSGDTRQLEALLPHIRSPYTVKDLLALREYESIWPQIERHAGDNLARLSDDYVAWAATRLADEPEDRDRLGEYSYALLFAGRFREAVDLAQGWLDQKQHQGAIEEGDGWALNIQAYAYDALGQPAEADRVFDRLAQLPADEHPWVVNFVINREVRLVELGRWQDGLAASELARPVSNSHGSPYARMLVASYRACALHKLGRVDEAAHELDFVREHFLDAPTSGGEALLCADRDDEAASLLARALADETARPRLLEDMQDGRFTLFGVGPSVLRQPRDLILARPELRDLALRHVRLLPDRFVPIAYHRRLALANAASGN